MAYRTFAEKTVEGGASHIKHHKPCQDNTDSYDSGDSVLIAVVADGHGSENCFRSEYGSRFAVDCARDVMKQFIEGIQEAEQEKPLTAGELAAQVKTRLVPAVVQAWNRRVDEHCRQHPITEEDAGDFPGLNRFQVDEKYRRRYLEEAEQIRKGSSPNPSGGLTDDLSGPVSRHAYGSTLIAAAMTPDYWFGIHIGDGKLTAFYPDGSYDQPVPWDPRCNLNITTSICDDDAAVSARVYVWKKGSAAASDSSGTAVRIKESARPKPMAVFLNSDGVDDNFLVDLDDLSVNMNDVAQKFYYPVLRSFVEHGWEAAVKDLEEYLPVLSQRTNGDDVSVAGIFDLETAKAPAFTAALHKWKQEREEARIAAAAEAEVKRKAAEAIAAQEKADAEKARAKNEKAKREARAKQEAADTAAQITPGNHQEGQEARNRLAELVAAKEHLALEKIDTDRPLSETKHYPSTPKSAPGTTVNFKA